MEQEENLIRILKRLNVLPIVVCFLMVLLLIVGFGVSKVLLIPISLFSLVSYSLIYFIEIEMQKSIKMIWIWALNLISTTIWLIIFSKLAVIMFTTIDIFPILLSAFIVGYPLYMLYYNFRLFMNEISKPASYDGFPNPSPTNADGLGNSSY